MSINIEKLENYYHSFYFSSYPDFDSSMKTNAPSIKSNSHRVDFPIETLLQEIRRVVTEKNGFDIQDESVTISFLEFSVHREIDGRIIKFDVSDGNSSTSW